MPCRSECPRQMTPAPLKYSIITFGCRVNQADSLAIARDLHVRGAVEASPQDAELVVVNTCSVTATADQGVRQTVRRVVRDNPGVRVIVTGCYATRRPDEIRELPNVLHVVSNDEKDDLVERLASQIGLPRLEDVTTAVRYGSGDGSCGETLSPGTAGRTALTLRVQTGCDETCSYCIIPTTRGKGRSRPLNAVVRQIEDAVASGYREIAIAGVHLGSYGRDLNDGTSLTALVRVLSEWDADVLFRISSLEPMDCTAEIVDLISSSPRLAPHFHLPLQHASNRILASAVHRECLRDARVVDSCTDSSCINWLGPDRRFPGRVFRAFHGDGECPARSSADALTCLPLLGPPGDRCLSARWATRWCSCARSWPAGSRHRSRNGHTISRIAARHHSSRADRRRWLVGRDG